MKTLFKPVEFEISAVFRFIVWTKIILQTKLFESKTKQNYVVRLKSRKPLFGRVIGRFDNSRVREIRNYRRTKSPGISSVCSQVTVFTRISTAALIKSFAPQMQRLFQNGAYLRVASIRSFSFNSKVHFQSVREFNSNEQKRLFLLSLFSWCLHLTLSLVKLIFQMLC